MTFSTFQNLKNAAEALKQSPGLPFVPIGAASGFFVDGVKVIYSFAIFAIGLVTEAFYRIGPYYQGENFLPAFESFGLKMMDYANSILSQTGSPAMIALKLVTVALAVLSLGVVFAVISDWNY